MDETPDIAALRKDAADGNPAAQYNLGVWHLTAPGEAADHDQARALFESAATKDFAPAVSALGYVHLRGLGADVDHGRAAILFARAADLEFPEAGYRLGELLASGCGLDRDDEAARAAFGAAARQGHALAMSQLAYCLANGIGGDGDGPAAARWYARSAAAGDPRAQCRLAAGYEHGDIFPEDLVQALAWYMRAAGASFGDAESECDRLAESLEPEQIREASRIASTAADEGPELQPGSVDPAPPAAVEVLSWSPRIFRFRALVTDEERHHLITLARPFLRPAMVLSRSTGERVHDEARRSRNARLIDPLRDAVVVNIEDRLARCSLLPTDNAEPIAILCYGPGDEYRPHSDYYDPGHPGSAAGLQMGGQRVATFLAYLNDVDAGGDTVFPRIDLAVNPQRGTGLLFFSCRPDGSPDPQTLHAGMPVRDGEKWLLSRWIRAGAYPIAEG